MSLQEEITTKTKEFRTDSYSMSIGEIANLYKDGELIIDPEFQRYFRWSLQQKSKFIESLLLGIPIPPIFVYQREDGIWELVDGLQRISTILEFMGYLKDEKGHEKPPLVLEGTELLPSLRDAVWETEERNNTAIFPKFDFRRAKIKVEIIQKSSDINAKFEVFERLNTGGSFLSYQEVRNSLLVMINKDVYLWLSDLASNEDFQNCISLTDRLLLERYDMELALRYVICSHFDLKDMKDVNEYLTDCLVKLSKNNEFDFELEKIKFYKLFSLLSKSTGESSFKKYDGEKFKGKFLESAYEAVTLGLGANVDNYSDTESHLKLLTEKVKQMWSESDFTNYSGSGSNARVRIPKMRKFGIAYFSKQ
ncbi:DUF262 domain-containing protein [Microcoleus sp. LAD1_D5]|uniref:DUF262 domain-containing protein n=1 Tax=unclassified Microcoleus TaxID=2642155 RepID=UPI002FCF7829